jgi:RHS repeat-associated protein
MQFVSYKRGGASKISASRLAPLMLLLAALFNANRSYSQTAPVINTAPHSGENVDASLCAVACFDAVVGYTTPAYFSMNTPRAVTLLYRSSQARPMPVVQVDVKDNSASAADMFSIRLKRPNETYVTFTNGSSQIYVAGSLDTTRLAVQFDGTALATGAYDYTVEVRAHRGGSSLLSTAPVTVLVVNEQTSRFGSGWSITGFQRVVRNGTAVTIVEGDGSARYFLANNCPVGSAFCTYRSPRGDFTSLKIVFDINPHTGEVLDSTYERYSPDGSAVFFWGDGRAEAARDRVNNWTTFGYDLSNRLKTITDPAGKVITLAYNGSGKLSTITDPGSPARVTTLTINASGDLTHILDPGGSYSLQATYDANHQMKTRTDRGGGAWGFAYDFAGKIAGDTMPTIVADSVSVRPVVRFVSSEKVALVDPASGLGGSGSPAPRVRSDSVLAQTTNPRGAVTRLRLDGWRSATRVLEPYARVSAVVRDDSGRMTRVVSPAADTTDLTWSKGNLIQSVNRTTGRTVSATYETTYNQLVTLTGDADSVWNYWSGGKLDSTRAGASNKKAVKIWYDNRGRDTLIKDPEGHETRTKYLATGWMNTDSMRVGVPGSSYRRTKFTYDSYGRRITTKDPLNFVVTSSFDVLNRITKVIGPGSNPDTTTFAYDALFQTSLTDAKGQQYRFFRNALGWVESDSFPVPSGVNAGRRYAYDQAGNAKSAVNRRGQIVSLTYDSLGNVLTRTADGATASFKTDPLGLFVAASNSESTDTLWFDRIGRAVSEVTLRGSTRYERTSTYNVRDLRTMLRITSPWLDTVRFTYSSAMELDTLVDFAGGTTRINYDSHRAPVTVTLPNGVVVNLTYPSVHSSGQVTYSGTNSMVLNGTLGVNYGFEDRGLILDRLRALVDDEGIEFEHDGLRRLIARREFVLEGVGRCETDAEGTHCPNMDKVYGDSVKYSYDKVGNRTDAGAVPAWGNRLVKFNGDSLVYDADGNLVKRIRAGSEIQRLQWNSLGELVAAWNSGSDSVSFAYDAFGRRTRKWTASATVGYVHDGENVVAEADGSGNRVVEYTNFPGIDNPHSMRRGGAGGSVYYFAAERPGTIVGLIDASGALVAQYTFDLWGKEIAASGSVINSVRFAARELDSETGLYFNRARYYDPALGRFVSEDPIGLSGGLNLYAYAANEPVGSRDPMGLRECTKNERYHWDSESEMQNGVVVVYPVVHWCVDPPIFGNSLPVPPQIGPFRGTGTSSSPRGTILFARDATNVADPQHQVAAMERIECAVDRTTRGTLMGYTTGGLVGAAYGLAVLGPRFQTIGGVAGGAVLGVTLGPEAVPFGFVLGRGAGLLVAMGYGSLTARTGGAVLGTTMGAVISLQCP